MIQQHDVPASASGQAGVAQPPAAQATPEPSHTGVSKDKFLRFGLDSLYLSFSGELSDSWSIELEKRRESARSVIDAQRGLAQISILDHLFEVLPHGRKLFRYILQDDSYRIEIAGPSARKIPLANCQIASECITHLGVEQAVKQLQLIVATFGTLTGGISVGRADLFVDFTYPSGILGWEPQDFVTRAELVQLYFYKRRPSGWTIGEGSPISARLYDKTIQIEKSKQDYLKALWHQKGWEPGQQVYRLELQLRHKPLVELEAGQYPELLSRLGAIWLYCLEDWSRLTVPNPNDDKRSRWPLHPLWESLLAVPWKDRVKGERIPQRKGRAPSEEYFHRQFLSLLSGYMAAQRIRDPLTASDSLFSNTRGFYDSRAFLADEGFDELLQARAQRKSVGYNLKFPDSPTADDAEVNEYLRRTGKG